MRGVRDRLASSLDAVAARCRRLMRLRGWMIRMPGTVTDHDTICMQPDHQQRVHACPVPKLHGVQALVTHPRWPYHRSTRRRDISCDLHRSSAADANLETGATWQPGLMECLKGHGDDHRRSLGSAAGNRFTSVTKP